MTREGTRQCSPEPPTCLEQAKEEGIEYFIYLFLNRREGDKNEVGWYYLGL